MNRINSGKICSRFHCSFLTTHLSTVYYHAYMLSDWLIGWLVFNANISMLSVNGSLLNRTNDITTIYVKLLWSAKIAYFIHLCIFKLDFSYAQFIFRTIHHLWPIKCSNGLNEKEIKTFHDWYNCTMIGMKIYVA